MTISTATSTVKEFPKHIRELRKHIRVYSRLPHSNKILSGKVLEKVFADAVDGHASDDNSFVDVIKDTTGWQLKSTMQGTNHLVWGRVKLEDKYDRIVKACESYESRDELGADLLETCNEKARVSMEKHGIDDLRYMHIKFLKGNEVVVTEVALGDSDQIFDPEGFYWEWADPVNNSGALIGFHLETGEEWFRWYGQNENHFHLTNEAAWIEEMSLHTSVYEFQTISTGNRLPLDLFELVVASAAKELYRKVS